MLRHVPLLTAIRPLYDIPRDASLRFPRYLTLLGSTPATIITPLNVMNPMAKPHITIYLDQLIHADIDALAIGWIAEITAELGDLGDYRHGFGVADDVAGGWTERSASEMRQRFAPPSQSWLTTLLFASDPLSIPYIRGLLRATCYRHYYKIQHGVPTTLGAMLRQEHAALHFGDIAPTLPPDDLTYTDQIIRPYLAATDYPTQIAVLWGDDVARHNGFLPLGFSRDAGLAWACANNFHQSMDNFPNKKSHLPFTK
ncbi:MAG: hypothetical protein EBS29_13545 [Chloroflexia bacterium]|nr:hypothetical protein [Chloroflexia bacterium]